MSYELWPAPVMSDYDKQQVAEILRNPSFRKYMQYMAHANMMNLAMIQPGSQNEMFSSELARARLAGSNDVLHTFLQSSGQ